MLCCHSQYCVLFCHSQNRSILKYCDPYVAHSVVHSVAHNTKLRPFKAITNNKMSKFSIMNDLASI